MNSRDAESPRVQAFIDRVTASSDKASALAHLTTWMTRNLTLDGRRYSFKHHECHIAIAKDQHPHKVVEKCSQVGLTELSLRIAAALCGVTRSRIIYVLPSARFSEKVSADRFYPIIAGSNILSASVSTNVKSAAMRKIGNSTIYFQGASGTSQAISIPANYLIIDEENFCDPVVLGQFDSRLRHAEEDPVTGIRGVTQRFSTPTIPKYGVSKHFEASDKKGYQVQCSRCNTWQLPDFYNDYVIPGFDEDIAVFEEADLANPDYKVDEAYVKCQKCGHDLWGDLCTPDRRQWVAEKPDVIMISGYQVHPIDVPHYNKVPGLIRAIANKTTQDHRNFTMGIPHEDRNNSFLMSTFNSNEKSGFLSLDEAKRTSLSGIRIGIDVGKTTHIVVGKRVAPKQFDIIHMATVTQVENGVLADLLQPYIDGFNPDCVVIDAAPDFTTARILIDKNKYGMVFACEYRRSIREVFSNIEEDEETAVVKADRSGTLSNAMDMHNKGSIRYPNNPETQVLAAHLKVTKKVTRNTEMGEVVSFPKPSEPDHYAHALNYCLIADEILDSDRKAKVPVSMPPNITGVKIGSENS